MSTVAFVTSFSKDLYEATGRALVRSFRDVQCGEPGGPGVLLCYTEGGAVDVEHPRVSSYPLETDAFLRDWLADNRDIIPEHLGGLAKPCACPGVDERHGKHAPRCHYQWMNRNASRWFRKVAAVRRAALIADSTRFLVWLDSDCRFVAPATVPLLAGLADGAALAYCQGHRPAVESGVFVLDLEAGGREIVDAWCRRYTSRVFRTDDRWDDGFQLGKVAEMFRRSKKGVKVRDLVHPTKLKGKTNDVVPHTDLAKFVRHFKGSHGRKMDIMK